MINCVLRGILGDPRIIYGCVAIHHTNINNGISAVHPKVTERDIPVVSLVYFFLMAGDFVMVRSGKGAEQSAIRDPRRSTIYECPCGWRFGGLVKALVTGDLRGGLVWYWGF